MAKSACLDQNIARMQKSALNGSHPSPFTLNNPIFVADVTGFLIILACDFFVFAAASQPGWAKAGETLSPLLLKISGYWRPSPHNGCTF
jgi:hypothetical protein